MSTALIIFGILSLPVITISWRTLFNIKSHGFYRFISWECIIWLFAHNWKFWFYNPISLNQIFSWLFLISSGYLVIAGVIMMRKKGRQDQIRNEETLYQFEKTTDLIASGIFKYIRHQLYSSLIFLTWGIFFKNTTIALLIVALFSTLFLYLTAIFEEKECINYFGVKYKEYMRRSKRFIPFII
jgi:protein-S-isoprenylcysteine O-methyltransferase Ste14